MIDIAKILFTVILINNIVLSQFWVFALLGLTTNLKNSMGMSLAVIFVMVVSSAITHPIYISVGAKQFGNICRL